MKPHTTKRALRPSLTDMRLLCNAPADDQFLVITIRGWLNGFNGQQEVWNALARKMGTTTARRFLNSLESFIATVSNGARRQIRHHRPCCRYLGKDEMTIAQIVCKAGCGELDSALKLAAEIVRHEELKAVVGHAAQLGVLVKTINAAQPPASFAKPTIH